MAKALQHFVLHLEKKISAYTHATQSISCTYKVCGNVQHSRIFVCLYRHTCISHHLTLPNRMHSKSTWRILNSTGLRVVNAPNWMLNYKQDVNITRNGAKEREPGIPLERGQKYESIFKDSFLTFGRWKVRLLLSGLAFYFSIHYFPSCFLSFPRPCTVSGTSGKFAEPHGYWTADNIIHTYSLVSSHLALHFHTQKNRCKYYERDLT